MGMSLMFKKRKKQSNILVVKLLMNQQNYVCIGHFKFKYISVPGVLSIECLIEQPHCKVQALQFRIKHSSQAEIESNLQSNIGESCTYLCMLKQMKCQRNLGVAYHVTHQSPKEGKEKAAAAAKNKGL